MKRTLNILIVIVMLVVVSAFFVPVEYNAAEAGYLPAEAAATNGSYSSETADLTLIIIAFAAVFAVAAAICAIFAYRANRKTHKN